VPVVEIEHDGIGRGLRPAMLAQDLSRADHMGTFRLKPVASSFETARSLSSGRASRGPVGASSG
jgi:hypothetical protein